MPSHLPLDVLADLSQQFRTIWEPYIAFYTAFIAMNIAGLALAVEKLKTPCAKTLMMWVFICQHVLAGATAVGLGFYSHAASSRAGRLLELQLGLDAGAQKIVRDRTVSDSPFPETLAILGAASNALGHLFFIAG